MFLVTLLLVIVFILHRVYYIITQYMSMSLCPVNNYLPKTLKLFKKNKMSFGKSICYFKSFYRISWASKFKKNFKIKSFRFCYLKIILLTIKKVFLH